MGIKISYLTAELLGFNKISRYRHKIVLIVMIKEDVEICIFISFVLLCRNSQFIEFIKSCRSERIEKGRRYTGNLINIILIKFQIFFCYFRFYDHAVTLFSISFLIQSYPFSSSSSASSLPAVFTILPS